MVDAVAAEKLVRPLARKDDLDMFRRQLGDEIEGDAGRIGQRLIDGVARKLADEFFEKFSSGFGEVQMVDAATGEKVERPPSGLSPLVWGPGLILVVAALIALALSL